MILTLVLSRCQKVYIHPYPIDTGTFVEKADQDFFFFFLFVLNFTMFHIYVLKCQQQLKC